MENLISMKSRHRIQKKIYIYEVKRLKLRYNIEKNNIKINYQI